MKIAMLILSVFTDRLCNHTEHHKAEESRGFDFRHAIDIQGATPKLGCMLLAQNAVYAAVLF